MQLHATPAEPAARRHRPKTLTVFAAAFAAGAVLAYGVNRVVDVHVVQVEPQVESEPIFVALRGLPQGSPITVWDVALKDWPKALLPTAALKADASFEGMVLRHPIREGQPLLSMQLVRDDSLLPGRTVAAAPAAPVPVVEQFRPALPAEPQANAAAVVAPPAAEVAAPAVTAAPGVESAPVVAVTPAPAAEMVAVVPVREPEPIQQFVPQPAQQAEPAPAVVEAAAPPMRAVVATVQPTSTDVDAPAALAAPVAAPAVVEPTPAALAAQPAADVAATPLAAPVPALPSTDLAVSLADASRGPGAAAEQPSSVLDRTTASEPPAPTRTAPKQHLVVPERIALAVDASFTQPQSQPAPTAATEAPAVAAQQKPATPAAAQARMGSSRMGTNKVGTTKQAAGQPAARKPSNGQRQPATRQQQSPAKGLSAWLPQFSGGRAASQSSKGDVRR